MPQASSPPGWETKREGDEHVTSARAASAWTRRAPATTSSSLSELSMHILDTLSAVQVAPKKERDGSKLAFLDKKRQPDRVWSKMVGKPRGGGVRGVRSFRSPIAHSNGDFGD
jgi:hypothetical protein